MQQLKIHPIALCEGPRDKAHFAYRSESSGSCNTACYIWYIPSKDGHILVDAGAKASTFTVRGTPETDIISVEDGLAKFNLKPEDIDIVIATHLHCDHIALGHLFKKAKFIVQEKELTYAQNPHPIDAVLYDKKTFENLKWEVINGDREITSGISVVLTPGHSPGGQSVVVNTTAGKAIITGFCSTLSTFFPSKQMEQRGWEVTIPLIHHDTLQTYNSALYVKNVADIVIPLHDPAFINKEVVP